MKMNLNSPNAGKAANVVVVEIMSRLGLAVFVTVSLCLGACTTTVQRSTSSMPVTRNSSPSDVSEMRIAESALDSGSVDVARTIYDRIVKANPNSVPGLTGLGNTLYAIGDFTRAGVYYRRASHLQPADTTPLIGIARVAIHQRNFDEAIKTYRQVLELTPNSPLASAGLGVALDLRGDHAAAQAVLRDALTANPGDPVLSSNLGLSLILSGNPREGANVLLDVTRYPAAPPQARQDLALAYGLMGNAEAAGEILSRDLPKASVQDNLRYYEIQRSRRTQAGGAAANPLTSTTSATVALVPPQTVLSKNIQ
jgi:Flp pilus assembly protein TadD